MAQITIYRVDFYDIQNDTMLRSRRWFTRDGAERVNGLVLEDTALEIDESALEDGEQWTVRDFNPHATKGFPRQVQS
jgi:hypothetical protein